VAEKPLFSGENYQAVLVKNLKAEETIKNLDFKQFKASSQCIIKLL
jgi:hypothetical protein